MTEMIRMINNLKTRMKAIIPIIIIIAIIVQTLNSYI